MIDAVLVWDGAPAAPLIDRLAACEGWRAGRVHDGTEDEPRICEELREAPVEAVESVRGQLAPALAAYRERFPLVPAEVDTGLRFLRYTLGGRYRTHVDAGSASTLSRVVSVVVFLNDDFDGGELVFPQQQLRVSPQLGRVVLFPSSFLFPHEVTPVIRGTRYSAVGWLTARSVRRAPPWVRS